MNENDRILTDEKRTRLNQISWLDATKSDFHFLQSLSDDQLLCLSMSADLVAVVESNRRVINALKFEGRITIALTVVIALLTLLLVYDAFFAKDKNEGVVQALEKVEKQTEMNGEKTEAALQEMTSQLRQAQIKQREIPKQKAIKHNVSDQ